MATNDPPAEGLSRWWRVVGGLSMNLALGSLYAWSVFVAPLEKQFGWKRAQTSNVFTIAVVVFALSFILAGRLQDKLGPFRISVIGGLLVSVGFFLSAYTTSLNYLYICFGVLGGIGNGFGYATPIPVMAKWFPDCGGIWWRVRHLRPACQSEPHPELRVAGHLQDSGLHLPGDDDDRGFPAEESAGGI